MEKVHSGDTLSGMKRRTFRQIRARTEAADHHNVYVALLSARVRRLRKARMLNPAADPKLPCVYVGMTGLDPAERFENHKAGVKAASVVTKYGVKLMPELYEHLNPMPFEAAARMEADLADDLRRAGYTVMGGY